MEDDTKTDDVTFVKGLVFSDGEGNSSGAQSGSSNGFTNSSGAQDPSSSGSTSEQTETSSGYSDSAHRVGDINQIYNSTPAVLGFESCQFALSVVEPNSHQEAIKSVEWKNAMKEEIAALEHHITWSLTHLPPGKKAIGLKWVYKLKFHADGSVKIYKARIVAKGYAQQNGIDYEETLSPVTLYTSSSTKLVAEFKQKMIDEFEMTDIGCEPINTPMSANDKLQAKDGGAGADAY
ncbi:hypothetical protein E3N88_38338 [Mikania micrantha]|uniref:Reverse transcriptase Ty1/copia-type domain-containing protein n=1 Tax=Mikania micrantha TaxID=192012 RepID=A0A5N6LTQ3_9ASTR|nr:hypothetical protein E3N88_38338 [Mikania micrantha]